MSEDFIEGFVDGIAYQCVSVELAEIDSRDDQKIWENTLSQRIYESLDHIGYPNSQIQVHIDRILEKYELI